MEVLLLLLIFISSFTTVNLCGSDGGGGSCTKRDCTMHGWGPWSTCTKTCGGGTKTRTRGIQQGPECGGTCNFPKSETASCNSQCCPVDCSFTYTAWSTCTGCGKQGSQQRKISILSAASCGGKACPTLLTEQRNCDTGRCCPVDCTTSNWGAWGACNAACDKMGKQTRTRTITRSPSCNGKACGSLTSEKSCSGPCCPKDCVLSSWSAWGKCNAPSGVCSVNGGTQTRSRKILKVAYCNGNCGATTATQRCTPQSIACKLSNWGQWSSCTPSNGKCGTGTRSRTRTIQTQPKCSAACAGLTQSGTCLHSCCPKNCEYNQWSQWGACTNQCGRGMQQRTRTIKSRESCGGVQCKADQQKSTRSCTVYHNIDCKLSAWSTWSLCSNGCGSGNSTRSRIVTVQQKCNGKTCGPLTDVKQCSSFRNNRDCVVSQWSSYGACSEKCAVGVRYRHRNITSPTVCNGAKCPVLTSTISCGRANGGCDHSCNSGVCSCRPGYDLVGTTTCQPKDCGSPSLTYCPAGDKQGGVCIYPTINCASSQTKYPAKCLLICPTGYTLVGESHLSCQTTGSWKKIQSYCKRDNEPPTNIILSGDLSIAENTAAPYDIGQLTTIDKNTNDSHTYTIKRDDCNCFSIVGNTLRALKAFDFEAQTNTFQIDIETKDNGIPHLSLRKTITITVTDVNESPTDIILSNGFVNENTDTGVVVGTLQTVDVDHNQTYIYTIVGGNTLFKIQGNQIITAKSNKDCLSGNKPNTCPLNFEKDQSITLMVNTKDSGSPPLDLDKQLTINIRDINEVPYDPKLSPSDVNENAPANTYIGTFSCKEEDKGQKLSYTLVDNDGGNFYVDSTSGKLYKNKSLDYESAYAHQVKILVEDNGSPQLSIQQTFTITVIDVNEPPVNVTLTNPVSSVQNKTLVVPENTTVRTMLATVLVYDRDTISTIQIGLDDTYNGTFTMQTTTVTCSPILGSHVARSTCAAQLRLSKRLNYEQRNSYDLKFRIMDRRHTAVRQFSLNVSDCNDAPSGLKIQNDQQISVLENLQGINIGTLSTDDEDANQVYSYQLLNEQATFEIFGNTLKLKDGISLNYEQRTSYDLNIRSTDDGNPAKSVEEKITINVININDPSSVSLTKYALEENLPKDSLVANITIVDEDYLSPTPSTHQCRAQTPFYVSGFQVYAQIPLDFEQQPSVDMVLTCTDQSLTSVWNFTMTVVDVNEPPTLIKISVTNITEGKQPPFYIGTLSCMDPEQNNCTYQIQSIQWKDFIEVRGNALYGITSLDYERHSTIDIDIQATDTGTPSASFVDKLSISVVDENETPLDITLSNNVVDENSPEYTVVGYLETIDEDRGQTHSYQLSNDAQGRFEIYNKTLRVSKVSNDCVTYGREYCALNFEKSTYHQVGVISTDNGNPPLSLSKNFTVYIRDANDAPHDITLSNYKVYENASVDTLIGTFNASDEDFGQTLTFKLIGGPTAHFYIDGQSQLKVKTNFSDYETQTIYKLLVMVEDNGARKMQASNYVTIEVLDVNEPPINTIVTDEKASQYFNQSNPHVSENTRIGTVVGTIYSYDADYASSLLFSLDDDSNGTFTIGNNTSCSNITLPNMKTSCKTQLLVAKNINYEERASHRILVRVTDQGGLFHVQDINIVVIDGDDPSTDLVINNYHTVSLPEGQRQDAFIVGNLRTIDEDVAQVFKYELVAGSTTRLFEIQNDKLLVKANAKLDYESVAAYNLTIRVLDGVSNKLELIDSVEIIITDVNEAPQAIQLSALTVQENSSPGTVVSDITVVDPDNFRVGAVNQTHNCTVMNSPYFEISSGNKLIVSQYDIDFEQKPILNIQLVCTDSGSPPLKKSQDFNINVQDVNEKPINITITSKYVMENAAAGMIGDLSTDDHDNFDGLIQQSFVYEILNQSVPFIIKNSTLHSTMPLDYESQNSYDLSIKSTDDGQPPLSTVSMININVIDVNEPAAAILLDSNTVAENAAKGTKIGDLSAIDPDRSQSGLKQQHTFELLQNPKGLFRIAGEQLEVALDCNTELCQKYGGAHCLLNAEMSAYQTLKIKVTDDGIPPQSSEQSFSIQVLDINEPPRRIQLSKRTLRENATIGYVIGRVTFSDEDNGDNHTVYLVDDDQGRFAINANSELIKAKPTNYEKQSLHHITIGVKDDGIPQLNATLDVTIYIEDVNESPTSLHITDQQGTESFPMNQARIRENLPAESVVGTIRALDQDTVTDLIFSLVDDAGGRFRLGDKVTCKNVTQNQSLHTMCETKLLTTQGLNYEENNVLVILVKVADHANLTHVAQFNISLVDTNDAPVNVTVSGEMRVFVFENFPDVEIGKLETVDEDSGQSHKYQLIDDAGQRFSIKPGSVDGYALYTTSVNINYEESDNYNVIVMTTDNGNPPLSYRHTITVQVFDINEKPSDILLNPRKVLENAPDSTYIGNITVKDPDNQRVFNKQTHSCSIIQHPSPYDTPFVLRDKKLYTRDCTNCAPLNYERLPTLPVYVKCEDSGYPRLSLVKPLTVDVEDVNEPPTRLILSNNNVPENIKDVYVGSYMGIDPDKNRDQNLTYQLLVGTDLFYLHGEKLLTLVELDYEMNQSHVIRVKVSDYEGLHYTDNFTLLVDDQNDAPTDLTCTGAFSIPETSLPGTSVGTCTAVDEDTSQTHQYQILRILAIGYNETTWLANPTNVFKIESSTGRIEQVKKSLNHEKHKAYVVTIQSTDSGTPPLSVIKNVTITVTNVNQPPTSIKLNNKAVTENSPEGTVVGQLSIIDPDNKHKDVHGFNCSIKNMDGSKCAFTVDKDSRVVVAVADLVDFEYMPFYDVNITCVENTTNKYSISKMFNIVIGNVNEAPTDIALKPDNINENNLPGAIVGVIQFRDPDNMIFDVDNVTVKSFNAFEAPLELSPPFTITANQKLNYETSTEYTVQVTLTDNGNPVQETTKNLTIKVNDQNDYPTNITLSALSFSEHLKPGEKVGTFSTIDEDKGQTYSYTLLIDGGVFRISNADLILKSKVEYKNTKNVSIFVQTTDNGNPPYSKQIDFNILVDDKNNPPSVVQSTMFPMKENTKSRVKVADLKVMDDDIGQSHQCSAISADFVDCVTEQNRNVSVYILGNKKKTDYESSKSFNINLRCSDNGDPVLSIDTTLTIQVSDVNENPTGVSISNQMIPENTLPGHVIGNLRCSDPDKDDICNYVLTGNSTDYFQIVSGELQIKNLSLNYEAPPGRKSMPVYLTATDKGGLSYSGSITITSYDVNEPPTDILLLEGSVAVPENFTLSKNFAQLSAHNPEAEHQIVTFKLLNFVDSLQILQDQSGSYLQLKKELDYDIRSKYSVSVQASDDGSRNLSSVGTVEFSVLRSDRCITHGMTCQQNASCTRISKFKTTCTCDEGFKQGADKNTCMKIDECEESCDNCLEIEQQKECKSGRSSPCGKCFHNGTCHDHHLNFTCSCVPGFTGHQCFTNINECENKPCGVNGVCIDGINSYRCNCYKGYEGEHCAKQIDECSLVKRPCYLGKCEDLIDSYKCTCPGEYTGVFCERKPCSLYECGENHFCHSLNLEQGEGNPRCIPYDRLVTLHYDTNFAPLSGDRMFEWKYKFTRFVLEEVKIPYSWLTGTSTDNSKDVSLHDFAIYEYDTYTASRMRRTDETVVKNLTKVSFYGIHEENAVKENVLVYAINATCDQYYTCGQTHTDFEIKNNAFECGVCRAVNAFITDPKNKDLYRPVVLSSTGDKDDPLWMDVLPIAGIALCGILLIVISVCIYRRRRNQFRFQRDRLETDFQKNKGTDLSVLADRSRTWTENDLAHYEGQINPMYGLDEDEVESPIVGDVVYRKTNPDWNSVFTSATEDSQDRRGSRMFDNPLYGISADNLSGDDDDDDNQNDARRVVNETREHSEGFFNPTFVSENPESEF